MSIKLTKKFIIRPAKNEDITTIKKIIFEILREYGLQPDETGKDKDLNDIKNNYFNNNGFFGVVIHAVISLLWG